jgi:hypothetical protein
MTICVEITGDANKNLVAQPVQERPCYSAGEVRRRIGDNSEVFAATTCLLRLGDLPTGDNKHPDQN